MRVKYLAQEHNAVPRPGLEAGPPDPESSALTIRPRTSHCLIGEKHKKIKSEKEGYCIPCFYLDLRA